MLMEFNNFIFTMIMTLIALIIGGLYGSIIESYLSKKNRQSQYDTIVTEFNMPRPETIFPTQEHDIQVIKRPSAQDLIDKQKSPKLRETEKAMEEALDQILS